MASIGSVSAIPYLPANLLAEEAGTEIASSVPGKAANAAAIRTAFLSPETAAALLIEQTGRHALTPFAGSPNGNFHTVGVTLANLSGAELRSPGVPGIDLAGVDLLMARLALPGMVANLTGSAQRLPGAPLGLVLGGGEFAGIDFGGAYLALVGTDGDLADLPWVSGDQAMFAGGDGNAQPRAPSMHTVFAAGYPSGLGTKSLFLFGYALGDPDLEGVVGTPIRAATAEASGLAMAGAALRSIAYANPNLESARLAGPAFQYTAFLLTDLMAAHLAGALGASARRAAERGRAERRRLLRRRLQWRLSWRRQQR